MNEKPCKGRGMDCHEAGTPGCAVCGWNPAEEERRRALPLVRDKATGLWRKYAVRTRKETRV